MEQLKPHLKSFNKTLNGRKAVVVTYITAIVTFLILVSWIFFKSYRHTQGYVTSDSSYYLLISQSISSGMSNYLSHSLVKVLQQEFVLWPIGYPMGISLLTTITDNPWLASKLLNVFALLGIAVIFSLLWKNKVLFFLPVILFSPMVEMVSYTWSETMFLFFILLSLCCYRKLSEGSSKPAVSLIFLIALTIVSHTRYVGVFLPMLIVLFEVIRSIKTGKLRNSILFPALVALGVFFGYLLGNWTQTGTITGERTPRTETVTEFFVMLVKGFAAELNPAFLPHQSMLFYVFSFAILLIMFGVIAFNLRKQEFTLKTQANSYWKILLLAGFTYWLAIISLRFISHFDNFTFRILFPGTFLVTLGVLSLLVQSLQTQKQRNILLAGIWSIGLFSFVGNVIAFQSEPNKTESNYQEQLNQTKTRYAELTKGSVVIGGSLHLRYLNPDVYVALPNRAQHSPGNENLEEVSTRFSQLGAKAIYLDREELKKQLSELHSDFTTGDTTVQEIKRIR